MKTIAIACKTLAEEVMIVVNEILLKHNRKR